MGEATIRLRLCPLDSKGLPSAPMAIAIVPLAVVTPTNATTYSITLKRRRLVRRGGHEKVRDLRGGAGDLICGQQLGTFGGVIASGALTPTVSIIGRPESATPFFGGRITSWDHTTGAIGVTPDPNGIVQEGDCFVIRFNADASDSASPTSIADSGCQNLVYPAA